MVHKSSYLSGYVKKSELEPWLRFLCEQPLYKHYNITVDWSVFQNSSQNQSDDFVRASKRLMQERFLNLR